MRLALALLVVMVSPPAWACVESHRVQLQLSDQKGPTGLVKVNDILLRLDGVTIDTRESLARQSATYNWGDVATLVVSRNGQEASIAILLRRVP